MKLFIVAFERAAKSGRLSFSASLCLIYFHSYKSLKMPNIKAKNGKRGCKNESKSIKFVTPGDVLCCLAWFPSGRLTGAYPRFLIYFPSILGHAPENRVGTLKA